MILTIPIETKVSLNSRGHWAPKAKRIALERQAVALAFKSRGARSDLGVAKGCNTEGKWVVTLTRVAPRALDDDNLVGRLKSVRDEVAKVLGIDDRRVDLLRFEYAQRKGPPKHHAVEVELRSVQEWRTATLDRALNGVLLNRMLQEAAKGETK